MEGQVWDYPVEGLSAHPDPGSDPVVGPAVASTSPDTVDAGSCVVVDGGVTGTRASLTPGAPVAEDAAFNRDDPDAEQSPLELI